MSLKLVHGVAAEGLTTCDHPESGAMGATEAHQQQQHSNAAAEDELCENGSVGFEFNCLFFA